MPLKLGTNFDYKAKQFLDKRINTPNTLQDLKEWDIPVPEGFEVFVGGRWYVWKSEFENEETGHWQKRIDNEYEGSDLEITTNEHSDRILELMNETFPLKFKTLTGGGTFEYGSSTIPTITWRVERKKQGVMVEQELNSATVNSSENNITKEGTLYKFVPTEAITDTKSYVVKAWKDGISVTSSTLTYAFKWKKYWGVSTTKDPSAFNGKTVHLGYSSAWGDSWTMGATNFNCSGGKYPVYIIPSSIYSEGTFKMWIGGLRNTDFTATTISLTNASGATREYKLIILNTLQNGLLSIKFEN